MPRSLNVKKLFRYQDGELYWRESRRGVRSLSEPAGSVSSFGYRVVFVDGKQYRYHRLIWFYFKGVTEKEIDHINRDKLDNRIENLRLVSKSQNLCNVSRGSTKGVWQKAGKWCAAIQKANRRIHLGYFSTELKAAHAYNRAAVKLHGEYACLN